MTWTDERVEQLVNLWDSGKSASEIGKLLGVSKNSVVGKAHRLKLKSRPSPIRRDQSAKPKVKVVREPITTPQPVLQPVQRERPRPLPRRAGSGPGCLWPQGDPGDPGFHFCGAESVSGKPYCEEHCARAYITKTRGETRAA